MTRMTQLALLAVTLSVPLIGHAHKAWLLPSATVLTPDQWITVDAAVSNDLFYFNHVPLRLESLTIFAPDGTKITPQNASTGKYRTTFDVHLPQNGTYKMTVLNRWLLARYEQNGEQKRWRGTTERFATEVPADAKNLQVTESIGRIETFVTAGQPNDKALQPSNTGLELISATHPNDLYAGEAASMRFLLDGQPATGLEVTVVPGGTRYRDQQQEMKFKTDSTGAITVDWQEPGMYWLEAVIEDQKTSLPQAKQRRASYVATFEVLPQ